jgi:hypothetical protein
MEEYSGTLYVFDFDDTLMWAPDWYEDATLDKDGFVVDPGTSGALKAALSLFGSIDKGSLADKNKNLRLKFSKKPQLDGRDIYFQVIDGEGNMVPREDLDDLFGKDRVQAAGIRGPSRYSEFAAVTDDNKFWRGLHTLGSLGINEEIMDIYREKADNAVILTARANHPGMVEKIEELMEEHAQKPLHTYVQPIRSTSSAGFKGRIIRDIAKQDSVDKVIFYDDNARYMKGVIETLEQYDRDHNTNLMDKVKLILVDKTKKPSLQMKVATDILEIANKLDSKNLFKEADLVEHMIKSFFEEGDGA